MKKIVLHNLRGGFATNSSSSHSLIYVPNLNIKDWDVTEEDNNYKGNYGRNWFVLDRTGEKRDYVAAILYEALSENKYSDRMIDVLMRDLVGIEYGTGDWGIDHQSVYVLPMDYDYPEHIDIEFFKELRDFILNREIVVLGGSDEVERNHGYMKMENSKEFTYPLIEHYQGDWISRKDKRYSHWTLFNKKDGTRIRMSFVDIPPEINQNEYWDKEMQHHPDKSQYPELIDIKITDFCAENCSYCYMGSTTKGKHASRDDLYDLARVLANMQVLEVALGGGEPTAHPDFIKIIRDFSYYGITPNFTTRSMAWLKDDERRKEIFEYTKAFAYSLDGTSNSDIIREICDILKDEYERDEWGDKITRRANFHIVMGTLSKEKFKELLETIKECGARVTLLGFKYTERGAGFEIQDYDWWLKAIDELAEDDNCPRLSVDTTMIQQFSKELDEANLPSWMYHKRDGSFSGYIDAVQMTFAPASYVSEDLHVKMPDKIQYWEDETMKWFEDTYQTF